MKYAKGDAIEVSCNGRTVAGTVILASDNGISLLIEFEALLGGHLGKMPVTMIDGTNGYSIIDGTEVTIVRKRVLQ